MSHLDVLSPSRARVLVLDDEDLVRISLSKLLRAHGYDVHTARTGADALVLLQEYSFSVMFCDVHLEAESGIEILPTALVLRPGLAVVMVSSANDADAAAQAMLAGAVDYLTKPIERAQLIDVTRRAVAGAYRTSSAAAGGAADRAPDAAVSLGFDDTAAARPDGKPTARQRPPSRDPRGAGPVPVLLVPPREQATILQRLHFRLSLAPWLPWKLRERWALQAW